MDLAETKTRKHVFGQQPGKWIPGQVDPTDVH